ncbi:MAG TPA: filamentous hemagglutinin N-terminal domain-containing protein [Candidatus Limnocylindria bacterium]|nr:filamentous hemagglutinin N-terminal domain-containing protein [Candidatus Limnocylindria bacterium]
MIASSSNPARPGTHTWVPLALGVGGLLCGPAVWANPQGMTVVSGAATILPAGSSLTITVSDRAVLNWQTFNVGPGQTTIFQQPNAASIVWNQVLDKNPSQIFGSIQANGIVVLANQAGFWFGPDSVVKAASFVATTASGPPPNFESGGAWNISYAPPLASIINYGTIEAGPGGSIFIVAEKIENHGMMMAPDGNIGLYAGKEVLVSERPDGRGLSAKLSLPQGSVDNHGKLIADAGSIAMQAQVVNQNGLVQANSVRERGGVIELLATDSITLGADSQTLAQGDTSGVSPGGQITIKSDLNYQDAPTAQVSVAGGAGGGNGGQVEISADHLPDIHALVQGTAAAGFTAGQLLIDPNSIVISGTGTGDAGSGTIGSGDAPTGQLTLNPSAFASFDQIKLQAKTTIDVNTLWSLPDKDKDAGARLILEAGTDLRFSTTGGIDAGTGWSVELDAGKDFATGQIKSGVGSVSVNGAGVATKNGEVLINAGKDVTVKGFVHTTDGGGISVSAVAGTINTGTSTAGYTFLPTEPGYVVNPGLGGISTAAGGDVTLNAGKDVVSYLPTGNGSHQDAGSGAFGPAHGDVTVTAGGNVYGHFVVANGTGKITAGNSAGDTGSKQLALSLISGSWAVSARDITLQEVRNPNGTFNGIGSTSSKSFHAYDYAPDAAVTLDAQNSVTLLGGALPRNNGGSGVPVLYAPSLAITAGAGGVTLGGNVTLFPSDFGQLSVTTTDGGDLRGNNPGRPYQLTMSDSDARQFTFASGQFGPRDHGAGLVPEGGTDPVPLHANDLQPVILKIDGSVSDLQISVPKLATITIGGDLINSTFSGQHLHASDVTLLDVHGDIKNFTDYTFAELPVGIQDPPLYLLQISEPAVGVSLGYDPATRQVALRGRLSDDQLAKLLDFHVLKFLPQFDVYGLPILDENGIQLTEPAPFLPASVLQALYDGSQGVPDGQSLGYQLAGPGTFSIRAHNLDLGASKGIITAGAQSNPYLADLTPQGAKIDIRITGDLTMFSSAIVSKAGGSITVEALQGSIQVGAAFVAPNSDEAQGIYTSAGSDVTVTAKKDILLNGSRIAAYDGGDITVKSLEGNVDAGTGGLSLQTVEQVRVRPDPDHPGKSLVETFSDPIPGSGILATTFSYGSATAGNITVTTPQGDILARAGGVVQASFNQTSTANSSVNLVAGLKGTDNQLLGPDGKAILTASGTEVKIKDLKPVLDDHGQPVLDANGRPVVSLHDDQGNALPLFTKDGTPFQAVLYKIDASQSGVIGGNVSLNATGDIIGLVFASGNANLNTPQNVTATVLAQGAANVSAGGTVSGTIAGIGSANVSGTSIDASVLSANATTSGATSGQVGFAAANVAGATASSASAATSDTKATTVAEDRGDDDDQRRKDKKPVLARTIGRVTVILPTQIKAN